MTNYPAALDDDDSLYLVFDDTDDVLAIHHNALKDAVLAVQEALGISGSFNFATDTELSDHLSDTSTHGVSQVADNADLHAQDHDNTYHSTNYEAANVNIQSHVGSPPVDSHHARYADSEVEAIITAEIVGGESIDNAIDALILTHKNLAEAHHAIYTHPTGDGDEHVPSGGSSGQYLKYASAGTAAWDTVTAGEVGAEASGAVATHAALTATHNVAQVANHAEIGSQISTHTSDDNAHHEVFESGDEDAAISTHAALTTGVHGVGASTVAALTDLHAESHGLNTHSQGSNKIFMDKGGTFTEIALGTLGFILVSVGDGADLTWTDHMGDTSTHGVAQVADNADLHSETHALATTGPHTGTLPLADLVVGSTGSVIRRGSADWEELTKGDDSDVLTLVSGYPEWVAQGAPGNHDIITTHTDTGLTIGYVIRASGATSFAWAQLSHSDLNDDETHDTLPTSSSTEWVACPYVGTDVAADDVMHSSNPNWPSNSSADAYIRFMIPLAPSQSGKDLFVKDVKILLASADADDYISQLEIRAFNAANLAGAYVLQNNDDYTTSGVHTYSNASADDVSGYDYVILSFYRFNTGGTMIVSGCAVEYYYE